MWVFRGQLHLNNRVKSTTFRNSSGSVELPDYSRETKHLYRSSASCLQFSIFIHIVMAYGHAHKIKLRNTIKSQLCVITSKFRRPKSTTKANQCLITQISVKAKFKLNCSLSSSHGPSICVSLKHRFSNYMY